MGTCFPSAPLTRSLGANVSPAQNNVLATVWSSAEAINKNSDSDLRHGRRGEALVPAGPYASFLFDVTSSFYTQQPGGPRVMKRM
jgi:hypothetical protein